MLQFDRRYFFFGIVLAILVFIITLLLFPKWSKSWRMLLALAVVVLVGTVGFLANWRTAFGRSVAPHRSNENQNGTNLKGKVDTKDRAKVARVVPQIAVPQPGIIPPPPTLIIGREEALRDLKNRLAGKHTTVTTQVLTAVRGWPGVGKTTLAAALAHDIDIIKSFPDGILWITLGPNPVLISELAKWGHALGTDDILKAKTLEEASVLLATLLRNKRMLLIMDDVWEPEHAIPFMVGGGGCAMLITTRINAVAQALAPTANDIYRVAVLSEEKSLELLKALAPTAIAQYPKQFRELVQELEGLPLALVVAGRMLNVEANFGFSVTDLLAELRAGAKLLKAKVPADRLDIVRQTTPTIAALLNKSTERLDSKTRDCFAYLGVFAPKPATFDLSAMSSIWQVEDPKPIVRTLVNRGLLEFVQEMDRYQMHALLVMHAKSLLTEV
jgi:hypothetical protein